ncbi:PP2C family protein-serine/threonine phosphatase [Agrococcus casei]|uniref:PP2C family protein-serine/threonine phosphatase n=1 Tax=Agrococcus casei TaxID=343512 RepID=UPI003F91725C
MSRTRDRYVESGLASVRFAGRTDVGRVRARNEDAVLARHPVFLVADGMGGHEHGERASASVLEEFDELVGDGPAQLSDVEAIISRLRQRVFEASGGTGGTTLTGAILVEVAEQPYWYILNVGDSRTYVAWRGRLEQISVDHSVVQESIDAGIIRADQAEGHPRRNIVTRALGIGDDDRLDSWLLPAERGQRLLVCSDGLTEVVSADDLQAVVLREASVSQASNRLVELALDRGGPDNVSVIVVEVDAVSRSDSGLEATGPLIDDDTNRTVTA